MLTGLRHASALADALAARLPARDLRHLRGVYVLALLAVLCFEMYAHAPSGSDARVILFLVGYVAIIGVADIVYHVSLRRQSQNKFQDTALSRKDCGTSSTVASGRLPDSAAD